MINWICDDPLNDDSVGGSLVRGWTRSVLFFPFGWSVPMENSASLTDTINMNVVENVGSRVRRDVVP
jgi:hypothetical protein